MRLSVPREVMQIIQRLQQHGWQAYLGGGACREMLLGHVPQDYDVATSARPEDNL